MPWAVVLAAAAAGSWGLTWGLPGRERLLQLMPAERADDPVLHRSLAEGRTELYRSLEAAGRLPVDYITEAVRIPGGWTTPPERLRNSYRSYFLRTAHPDEQKTLTYLAHMKPRRLDFEPYGVDYGGGYVYPLGAVYGVLGALRIVRVSSDLTVYLADVSLMARVFLAGRILNVLCFALCGLLLFRFARRSWGAAAGAAAAFFFLSSPVVSVVTHTLNPYGWATAWCLLAFGWFKDHLDGDGDGPASRAALRKGAAAIGACIGCSFAFIPVGALLLAPLFASGAGRKRGEKLFLAAEAAAVAGAVFVALNPYLFLRFEKFTGQLVFLATAFPYSLTPRAFAGFIGRFLMPNWGVLQTVAGLAGVAYLLVSAGRSRMDRLLGAVFCLAFLNMGGRMEDLSHGRHFLPFFAIGSAAAAGLLWERTAGRRRPLAWVLSAAVFLDAAAVSASYLRNYAQEAAGRSTRSEASRWIAGNVPAGSSVGLLQPPQYSETPPFRFDRHELVLFGAPEQLQDLPLPDFVVANEAFVQGRFAPFFASRYEAAAAFRPRRLFPWIPVRGVFTMSNLEFVVLRRRPEAAK